MKINILTIFPDFFTSFFQTSIIKRSIERNLVEINYYNFRDFTKLKHNKVDDYQYGGGAGMVLSVQPIIDCLKSISNPGYIIALSPTGKLLNNNVVKEIVEHDSITIICGHYEGFDERVYDYVDNVISIGDYILTGGEVAATVLIDCVVRNIKGVINDDSLLNESFNNSIFDYPVYTVPKEYDGKKVPNVLLSGNHELISKYRKFKAIEKTLAIRPQLLDDFDDKELVLEYFEKDFIE